MPAGLKIDPAGSKSYRENTMKPATSDSSFDPEISVNMFFLTGRQTVGVMGDLGQVPDQVSGGITQGFSTRADQLHMFW